MSSNQSGTFLTQIQQNDLDKADSRSGNIRRIGRGRSKKSVRVSIAASPVEEDITKDEDEQLDLNKKEDKGPAQPESATTKKLQRLES